MSIAAIKVLRGCGASGQSLAAGSVYAVPAEVSEPDARLLVQLGKAVGVPAAAAEPARKRRRKAGDE